MKKPALDRRGFFLSEATARKDSLSGLAYSSNLSYIQSTKRLTLTTSGDAPMATLGPEKVQQIQEALQQEKIDGWLFYNFRGSNVFATRIINLPAHIMQTRRYFYFIPASGSPQKLVHNIEQWNLDMIPGDKILYVSWQSLREGVKKIVGGAKKIAMEYSPMNNIPYVSNVDAGTVELVRALGLEVVSSANLVSRFESTWDDEQAGDNMMTAKHLRQIVDLTFGFIKQRINAGTPTTEYDVQQF
ncbi:MAG: Peptidase, partial [Bacteroidetes bacterium]|nr:Peptidase [Bacteroidota bacterium]